MDTYPRSTTRPDYGGRIFVPLTLSPTDTTWVVVRSAIHNSSLIPNLGPKSGTQKGKVERPEK